MSTRVALGGIILESNAFAPIATERNFREHLYLEGDGMVAEAGKTNPHLPKEMVGFIRTMNATGPWQPMPTLIAGCPPSGPVEAEFFDACVDKICTALRGALPLDAVYLANHGAMTATHDADPDGAFFARVREVVGPETLIIATLDLHANISDRMVAESDLLIGYRTNPHVDQYQRGEEAAFTLRTVLASGKPASALVRLPLTPPSTTLLTREGPYADIIDYGQRRLAELGGAILNVSAFGGFVFSDTPYNGIAIVVTARDDAMAAQALALEMADHLWRDRERFQRDMTSIADAVALAVKTAGDERPPAVIFSDAGDNPGGGGSGTTTWLLEALIQAGARRTYVGAFFDPALAAEAHALGEDATFHAQFNRTGETEFAKRLSAEARVLRLGDGEIVGRLGIFAGQALSLGPCAALEIGGAGGIVVVVISHRQQAADPMFFEMFGLDIADARTVVVKSRGHFRAGFEPWFKPEQIYEVDTPGLTSPVLARFQWRSLPRPVYPLDEDTVWIAPDGS